MLKPQTKFNLLLEKHQQIYLIISPPRCSSTALARVFWEHPTIQHYSHEPFEVLYYENADMDVVFSKLQDPLNLAPIKANPANNLSTNGLVIKEMPYQVGKHFPTLAAIARKPIVFLIRDPRLNISSRITKKIESGDNPNYPFIESGWDLLCDQIQWCEVQNIPYVILDATDFRNFPRKVFDPLFARFNLSFSSQMLTWKACEDVRIDNLNGHHSHLYHRILNSKSLHPALETIPRIEDFTEENGLRAHVIHCLKIYEYLSSSPNRITPGMRS